MWWVKKVSITELMKTAHWVVGGQHRATLQYENGKVEKHSRFKALSIEH
jgi:hypothetical protein